MAWTPPTVTDFKTRFPEFAAVPDATVQAVLDEAVLEVSPSWVEAYRTPGVLNLTAHLLATQGFGGSGAGGGGAASSGAIKRRKVGDVETEWAGISGGGGSQSASFYNSTRYGQRYYELLRKNIPAVSWVV